MAAMTQARLELSFTIDALQEISALHKGKPQCNAEVDKPIAVMEGLQIDIPFLKTLALSTSIGESIRINVNRCK